jgi:hypothetical protein
VLSMPDSATPKTSRFILSPQPQLFPAASRWGLAPIPSCFR